MHIESPFLLKSYLLVFSISSGLGCGYFRSKTGHYWLHGKDGSRLSIYAIYDCSVFFRNISQKNHQVEKQKNHQRDLWGSSSGVEICSPLISVSNMALLISDLIMINCLALISNFMF